MPSEDFPDLLQDGRIVADLVPDAITIHVDGRIVYVNQAALRLAGAESVAEILGRPLTDFVHPDYHALVRLRLAQVPGMKRLPVVHQKLLRIDGTPIDVEVFAVPVTFDGQPATISIARDITERKKMEEALRSGEEHFRALIDNAQDLISILDADGIIRYESPASKRMLGYLPQELIGKSAFDFFHPDDLDRAQRELAQLLANPGDSAQLELRCRHKDGHYRVLEAIGTNLLDVAPVNGIVVNCRDITERTQAEAQLKERTEELERTNRFMVGRELKMIELKKRIEALERQLRKLSSPV